MTKESFMQQLKNALKRIPEEERTDILQDYEEHFAFGLEEGKTEEEIASALGSPSQIAKELQANYHLEKVTTNATTGNIFRALWAVIGLGFFNLVIVLGPAIAIAAIIFSGWAVGVSFLVSPLLVLLEMVVYPNGFAFFDLFFSLVLCGIGYFILVGMLYVSKLASKGFVKYLAYNVSLVKGGLKHEK